MTAPRPIHRPALAALVALAGAAVPALGQDLVRAQTPPVILQWWETRWIDMERRTPDFFVAGYGGLWLPPVHKAATAASVGYDPFDRFDLGRPGSPTAYGTEQEFRAVVAELQAANAYVTVDVVMNHNSGRNGDRNFWLAGGYPGFWGGPIPAGPFKFASDNWGDFNNNPAGGCCTYLQSENPSGPNYNLIDGDLVALIDIAHQNGGPANRFVRHPVDNNPRNEIDPVTQLPTGPLRPPIPAGSIWNIPTPANAAFYQDRGLAPMTFTNPGTLRNPLVQQVTVFPFNTANPQAGDPIPENANDMLARWTQWMLDVYGIDGFRIDAIKHTPTWFFDNIWDNVVHMRRVTPWGARVTPFTYGESVEGNAFTLNNYVRKDTFANRDALDLNGAGQLRNIINAAGLGDWANVLAAHLDSADDGLNNNTLGVNHVFSHDNGSVGNGSSQPPLPSYQQQGWATHAYLLLRGGLPIVYHNARGIARPGGFWPREGLPIALGMDPFTNAPNSVATTLVRINNNIGRGDFRPLTSTSGGGSADVLVFERFRNPGGGQPILANAIVGVNDRYDAGSDLRSVTTSFPQGQVLVEQTGNADDPVVDPTNAIPSTITVGPGGTVSIRVPRNASSPAGGGTTVHHRGFVVYAPAIPQGTVNLSPIASTIAPDPSTIPLFRRRTTAVPVITAPSFTLELATTPAVPLAQDPDVDDNAVFRVNRGFVDLNGNGQVDFGPGNDAVAGFELFNTLRQPGTTQPSGQGLYRQTINAALLPEGYNYITVRAFKRRPASTDPLWREVRQVVYIDRLPPQVNVTLPPQPVQASSALIRARAADRTASNMWAFANLPAGANPTTLISPLSQMLRVDRFEWQFQVDSLASGENRITVVAAEDSGRLTVVFDGSITVQLPCYPNCDGSTAEPRLTPADFVCFLNKYRAGDPYANCDGSVGTPILTPSDFICFLAQYRTGCP